MSSCSADAYANASCSAKRGQRRRARTRSLRGGRRPGRARSCVTVEATAERLEKPLASAVLEAQADLVVDLQEPARDASRVRRPAARDRAPARAPPAHRGRRIGRAPGHLVRLAGDRSVEGRGRARSIAARLSASYDIPTAAFYAFLRQHIPGRAAEPLLDATDGFKLIDPLTQRIASLIFALSAATQTQALESAIAGTLMPGLRICHS